MMMMSDVVYVTREGVCVEANVINAQHVNLAPEVSNFNGISACAWELTNRSYVVLVYMKDVLAATGVVDHVHMVNGMASMLIERRIKRHA
jgi:hypothetical protein